MNCLSINFIRLTLALQIFPVSVALLIAGDDDVSRISSLDGNIFSDLESSLCDSDTRSVVDLLDNEVNFDDISVFVNLFLSSWTSIILTSFIDFAFNPHY